MKTPVPQSALDQMQTLARQAEEAVNELLQYSELHARPSGGIDYREWRATSPAAGIARSKALGLFHAFEDDLHLILSWHDPTNDQVQQMESHSVFEIINQRAHTQLASLDEAKGRVGAYFSHCLRTLGDLYDRLDGKNLIIPDTNVLIDFPELERYHLGLPRVIVVFTPIIVRELDARKRHKARDTHDVAPLNARNVIRRLKQCGDVGDILESVPISDRVSLMALAAEPKRENFSTSEEISIALPTSLPIESKRSGVPGWLDLDVPDDRFIASALEVRREYPRARILVVSGDFNVLTKARAARLAAFDAEAFFENS